MFKSNKDNILEEIVKKTKLYFYRSIFKNYEGHKFSLTIDEGMILEIIEYLDKPTINDLVNFLCISQPNVSYKINILQKKGYVAKTRSDTDGRQTHVNLTDKYFVYRDRKNKFTDKVLKSVRADLTKKEREYLHKNLDLINDHLTKELRDFLVSDDWE